ncbi:hypothetical protein [Fibrella arboris]|uniref:hypothetical protein n=1 Tax=Fibrella arboris TaxID=3242486 RepID=UPI0035202D22
MNPYRGLFLLLVLTYWVEVSCQAQSGVDSTSTRTARNQQTYQSISRSSEDSTKSVFNFKAAPWYGRANPLLIYTGLGAVRDRISQSVEIGKSFNVIDLGVAVGRNSLRPDSTMFLEGRVTMDVANYGVFANEMTIGAGRVFDKAGSLMLELTYSIIAQVAPRLGIGLTTGYYDFSSEFTDSSKTFYGVYLRYGLLRTDSGGLLGNGRARPPRVGRPARGHTRGHGR